MCNFKEDFQRYLRVNVPILYIDTFENDIAFEKIKKFAEMIMELLNGNGTDLKIILCRQHVKPIGKKLCLC